MEKSGKHRNLTEISWVNYRAHIQQNPIYNMREKINVSDLPPVAGQASRQSTSPYYHGLTNTDGDDIYGESVLGKIFQQPHKRFVGIIPQRPLGREMAEILINTTQKKPEEAARAYDEAAFLFRGPNTGTNSRQRDPNSSNFTSDLVLSKARNTSKISNWNSSSSASSSASSTPFMNQIHVIRFAHKESYFSESNFTDYERPSLGRDITQTLGARPDNSASNPNYNFQLLPHTGGSISTASSPNDHEVLIDIIRLIEKDCINYDKRVHSDNYHPVVTTFHDELKLEKKPRLLFDRGYGMMRETTLALCGQAVGAVMTNALANSSSSSSSSSSSCAVWMSEIAVALGLCFIMAGISLREKRRDFSIMMTKFGAIATSWAIIISLGSHLPPVMGWAVATVAFFIVAASVAFA